MIFPLKQLLSSELSHNSPRDLLFEDNMGFGISTYFLQKKQLNQNPIAPPEIEILTGYRTKSHTFYGIFPWYSPIFPLHPVHPSQISPNRIIANLRYPAKNNKAGERRYSHSYHTADGVNSELSIPGPRWAGKWSLCLLGDKNAKKMGQNDELWNELGNPIDTKRPKA